MKRPNAYQGFRPIRFSYRWLPSTMFKNLEHAWYDLYYGVRNLVRWFPIIWADRNYDWLYIAKIIRFKLLWTAYHEETLGHHTTSKRDAKRIRICAELIRRIIEDEYYDKWFFGNKYASGHYVPDRKAAWVYAEKMQQADLDYFAKLFSKHLTGWRD